MSSAVDAVRRSALREVRDVLLARARSSERARDHFIEQRNLGAAALEDRSASTFRQAAQLADAQLGAILAEVAIAEAARDD